MSKTELRYGTLIPKLPILVANDGRGLPQTFEGGQITSSEFKDLTLTGGRIEHATGRGSTDQTGLAVLGGKREPENEDAPSLKLDDYPDL
ncbi:Porin-like protein NicP precursor [compost metagenome]